MICFLKGFLNDWWKKKKLKKFFLTFDWLLLSLLLWLEPSFLFCLGGLLFFQNLLISKVVGIGIVLIFIIYVVRFVGLLIFNKTTKLEVVTPEVFVAPRGLITILLFYKIPDNIKGDNPLLDGILLFVILFSCLIMSWSLISNKTSKTDEASLLIILMVRVLILIKLIMTLLNQTVFVDFEESEKTENNS